MLCDWARRCWACPEFTGSLRGRDSEIRAVVSQFVWPDFEGGVLEGQAKGGKTGETAEEFDCSDAGCLLSMEQNWWVAVLSMIGPEKGTNNSILTGLTGLVDRTACHREWLGETTSELIHYGGRLCELHLAKQSAKPGMHVERLEQERPLDAVSWPSAFCYRALQPVHCGVEFAKPRVDISEVVRGDV